MNINKLFNKYKSVCEIEGTKLEYISKQALIELVAEIISQPLEAVVKPANGDIKKTINEFFDDYLLDKDNCFYIDSIKYKNNINFAALILLQAKMDLLSRLSV